MNLKSKRIIPLIILLVCYTVLVSQHFSTSARRATFESNRTRYMSDILRITNGVMPVLWISPEYSFESTAKYFDLSGNANHATQDTAGYRPTVAPPGLSFDGTNDYVNCGSKASLNITDAITIEAWIKPNAWDVWDRLLSKGDPASLFLYTVGIADLDLGALISLNGTSAQGVISGYKPPTGEWTHIVVTYDKTTLKIYLNSVSQTVAGTANFGASAQGLIIGRRNDNTINYFNGTIDEVRIYNFALSATQIQQLYLLGLPKHRQ